jgi:hypothetical protein
MRFEAAAEWLCVPSWAALYRLVVGSLVPGETAAPLRRSSGDARIAAPADRSLQPTPAMELLAGCSDPSARHDRYWRRTSASILVRERRVGRMHRTTVELSRDSGYCDELRFVEHLRVGGRRGGIGRRVASRTQPIPTRVGRTWDAPRYGWNRLAASETIRDGRTAARSAPPLQCSPCAGLFFVQA